MAQIVPCTYHFQVGVVDAVELRIRDVPILTLAPTDHLLFLLCHAYKHLLHGGIGIRQLCEQKIEECYARAQTFMDKVSVSEERKAILKAYAAAMMKRQS